MAKIHSIEKVTNYRFLNMYVLDSETKSGHRRPYYVASRAKDEAHLKIRSRKDTPDGMIIYSIYGENRDKVVLIRQYRCAIDDYIYEFPAGLVEEGEDAKETAKRELKEETGLDFIPVEASDSYTRPFYTTIGMTDECCGMIYGYASGIPSKDGLEDSEEIELVIADREECKRILKEERVSLMCAYMLMHFIHCKDGNPFGFLDE
ncbi:MAG: NUDIX hydrolase [Lachnospiraceae bacterium]